MLVKPADPDAAIAFQVARLQGERTSHHLGERRFARTVHAEEPDPIVDIQPQIEVAQDRLPVISDARGFELQQGRRQRPGRRRQRERRHALLDHCGDRLELCQTFHSRLRLGRLAGLGAESIHKRLQMGALGLLLGAGGGLQSRLFCTPLLEIVIASGVQIQLAFAQMQDGPD